MEKALIMPFSHLSSRRLSTVSSATSRSFLGELEVLYDGPACPYGAACHWCGVEDPEAFELKEDSNIPPEAPWRIKDRLPSPNWPIHGDIILRDLKVRYRPNTPLVLHGITLDIHGGEKIGVVGRTGSGKSTLIQALFRIVEPSGGKIIIDGVDICILGLHNLRSRFGIIPQEPVLFEGTVRSNVDPVGQYTDDEIWQTSTGFAYYGLFLTNTDF
ncbi:hypothetical protein M5K25_003046 [Dendrobium thyrsiflorum]|uniref:ABC transporter domain-containing protein n=1 Tax=Dendrobium thyrsiflorum TaxID=117978 RepID=A0ABD0VPB1_DENTH